MSLKRPLSPVSCPPAKRRSIEAWLGLESQPYQSIESDEQIGLQTLVQDIATPSSSDMTSTPVDDSSDYIVGQTATGRKISYPQKQFLYELRRRNIYKANLEQAPRNFDALKSMLKQHRISPEPGEAELVKIYNVLEMPASEAKYVQSIIPIFLKLSGEFTSGMSTDVAWARKVAMEPNLLWKDYVPFAPELNTKLPAPQPDFSLGWEPDPESFPVSLDYPLVWNNKDKKTTGLSHFDCVSGGSLIWPVLTVEAKSGKDNIRTAVLQNAHSGAVMLNNIRELYSRVGEEFPYGEALILTISMSDVALKISCHWIDRVDEKVRFFYKTLAQWLLDDAPLEEIVVARRAMRNCMEYSLEERYKSITAQLDKYKTAMTARIVPESTASGSRRSRRTSKSSPNQNPALSSSNTSRASSPERTPAPPPHIGTPRPRHRKPTASMDLSAEASRAARDRDMQQQQRHEKNDRRILEGEDDEDELIEHVNITGPGLQ